MKLCELPPGAQAEIVFLNEEGAMRRRLTDMGFTAGVTAECELKGVGMSAYRVRGALVALRRENAEKIIVEGSAI